MTHVGFGKNAFSVLLLPLPSCMQNVRTPLDMVRSPSLPYADVFDLPLSMLFFWVFPNYSEPYRDTYELAVYLLQRCVCVCPQTHQQTKARDAQVTLFDLGVV